MFVEIADSHIDGACKPGVCLRALKVGSMWLKAAKITHSAGLWVFYRKSALFVAVSEDVSRFGDTICLLT